MRTRTGEPPVVYAKGRRRAGAAPPAPPILSAFGTRLDKRVRMGARRDRSLGPLAHSRPAVTGTRRATPPAHLRHPHAGAPPPSTVTPGAPALADSRPVVTPCCFYVAGHRYRHWRFARAPGRRARRRARGFHGASRRDAHGAPPVGRAAPRKLVGRRRGRHPRRAGRRPASPARRCKGIGLSGQMHGLVILDAARRRDPPVADLVRSAQPAAGGRRQRARGPRERAALHRQPGAHGLHPAQAAVGARQRAAQLRARAPHAAAQGLRALPAHRRVRQRKFPTLPARRCSTW